MMGAESFKFTEFIDEVTPHEIAHQWWGHMVGWATYHDQWLSEGFAEFSAGLFLEMTRKPAEAQKFWDRLRLQIIEKNSFGNSANDAGPIWLGYRLDTPKSPGAARRIIYPKGAYLAQMIRMLMRDEKTGDQDFSDMMKDYVKTNLYRNASSEQDSCRRGFQAHEAGYGLGWQPQYGVVFAGMDLWNGSAKIPAGLFAEAFLGKRKNKIFRKIYPERCPGGFCDACASLYGFRWTRGPNRLLCLERQHDDAPKSK